MKYDWKSFGCGFILGCLLAIVACSVVGITLYVASQSGAIDTGSPPTPFGKQFCPVEGDESVTSLLKTVRQEREIPAMTGAIVTSEGLIAVGVVGVRKWGTMTPVTLEDRWHLGSDTKAMTATLVARMVEQGRLKWDTTMGEVFPEMAAGFDRDMKEVTVLQLLLHRSGLPGDLALSDFLGQNAPEERLRAVQLELAKAPQSKPGDTFRYSNLGYIIVGAAIERITGESWEDSIRKEVFVPLEMDSVGFGGMGTPGRIDQPWGHAENGEPVAGNGPPMDNPPVMGPAGRVHCTIQDWARFVADQLRGVRGDSALLASSSYKTLHTPPPGGDYALGWMVLKRDWGGGPVLHHGGSNGMHFANAWIAPERDFAVLVCVNQGGDSAFKATDDAVGRLIKLHASREKGHN